MDSENQEVIYCPEGDEYKYIVKFVINYVLNDFIKIISNHKLIKRI